MPSPVTEGRVAVRTGMAGWEIANATAFYIGAGVCAISYYLLRAFFTYEQDTLGKVLGWLGGPGKWVQRKIEDSEQKVTHWVGQAAAGAEGRAAGAMHAFADTMASVGYEIQQEAIAYWQAVQWIAHTAYIAGRGEDLSTRGWFRANADLAHTKALEQASKAHGRAITHADTGPIAGGILHWTRPLWTQWSYTGEVALPNLRARAKAQERAIPQDQAGMRARTAEAEGGIERLWEKVKHLDKVTTGVLASALVATALGRLGLGWVGCSRVGRLGKSLCGMPQHLFEDLLGLLTDFVVLTSICRVIPWLETGFGAVATPLIGELTAAGKALHCGGGLKNEILDVPQLYYTSGTVTQLHIG